MNLKINGYTLKMGSIKELLEVMSYGVVARTKSEAKSILHLMRLLGIKYIAHSVSSKTLELNVPCKAEANHVYKVETMRGVPVVTVWDMTVGKFKNIQDVIAGKSLITWIQDI